MKKRIVHFILAALAVVALGGTASALPTASLSFVNPLGPVSYTDSVPVWVTLTLTPTTGTLTTDSTGNVLELTAQDYTNAGIVDPSLVASSDLNVNFLCDGTFTPDCNGTPYLLNLNLGSDGPSLYIPLNLSLADGSSTQFLLATYAPFDTSVPAGHYSVQGAPTASVSVELFDAGGNNLADIPLASTNDAFSVDVNGPEPGTVVLMLGGLALVVAGVVRRKAA